MRREKGVLWAIFTDLINFLTNRLFIFNLLGVMAFMAIIILGTMQWLKFYTNHGQRLEIPDLMDIPLTNADIQAGKESFQIVVTDSVHIVGKPGGIVQNQNPKPGSLVKEGRKIYVTTTKYQADKVSLANVKLYGEDYELKKRELNRKGIATNIKGWVYHHQIEEGTISEVWQGDRLLVSSDLEPEKLQVEKGSQLEFILIRSTGGVVQVPSIIGMTVAEASFTLSPLNLSLGTITNEDGAIVADVENAEIVSQALAVGSEVETGSNIDIVVITP